MSQASPRQIISRKRFPRRLGCHRSPSPSFLLSDKASLGHSTSFLKSWWFHRHWEASALFESPLAEEMLCQLTGDIYGLWAECFPPPQVSLPIEPEGVKFSPDISVPFRLHTSPSHFMPLRALISSQLPLLFMVKAFIYKCWARRACLCTNAYWYRPPLHNFIASPWF